MSHTTENDSSKLDYVLCSASNCIYNNCDKNICVASHINVGSQKACCIGETFCKTFKLK